MNWKTSAVVIAVILGSLVGNLSAQEESVKEAHQKLLEAQRQFQQAIEAQAKEAARRAKEAGKPHPEGFPPFKGKIVVTGPDGKQMVKDFTPGEVPVMFPEWNEFIIGVTLRPVPEGIHGLIGVDEGVGVLIDDVLPDSPAQKSGIQRHDLIIGINGEPVRSPEQVQKLINNAGEQELTLQLRRKSESLETKVTPRKNDQPRPEFLAKEFSMNRPFITGENFHWFGPGMVTPLPGVEAEAMKKELKSLHQKLQEQQDQLTKLMEAVKELQADK